MVDNAEQEVRDGKIETKVSKDRMEAFINVTPAVNGKDATYDDAVRELRNKKVVYGINEELLMEIFENKIFEQELPIASGLPAVDGVDGKIKYFFEINRKIKPKEDSKGNVDFKDLNIIQSAKKNQKLAEVIPPKKGEEGKMVTGEAIIPKEGKVRQLPQGSNTMPEPENPQVLISAIDGHIMFKGGVLVEVEPAYTVNGNVDFNTGNINYVGSIVIKGDVKSGFEVKVEGDADIWGVVEDAKIEVGGNVLLQKGIVGRGEGVVKAEGEVIAKYIENQSIICKGNVTIGESAHHSNVFTEGKLIVKGQKGQIIGGEIIATLGVEVKNLGNYQNLKTEVFVGIREDTKKKLDENEINIRKNEENAENVKKAIYTLVRMKYAKTGFTREKEALLNKMQKIQKLIPEQMKELEKEKEEVEKELQKYGNTEIKVYNKVYPGVKITILNKKHTVLEERSAVSFKLVDNEVVCTKL